MHERRAAARRPIVRLVGAMLALSGVASCGGSPLPAPPPDAEVGADASDASSTDAPGDDSGAVIAPLGAGCGKQLPASQPVTVVGKPTGYLHYTVNGTGATLDGPMPAKAGPRTFWVRVPTDYDPNHKYRVVYIGQGCGGYDVANTATYPLYNEKMGGTEQAIYVALDIPTDMANQDCYDNRDGPKSQEWEAFELIHSVVDANYCVDNDNVMVTGYSTGAWLTNMWGCYFAGDGQHPWNGVAGGSAESTPRRFAPRYHIRAQAGTGGGEPDNNPPCNGPIAAMWFHDMTDANPIAADRAALARVLRMNGCEGSPTKPWHPELASGVCVQYTACPASYPVVFCETNLCHTSNEENFVPAVMHFYSEMVAQ